MASGTARSGRCVVTKATRSGPRSVSPASIITTKGVSVFCARYSVWPVNGIPASLMTPLCTGAVAMAANSPLTSRQCPVEQRQDVGPLAASRCPAARATRAADAGLRGYPAREGAPGRSL